MLLTFLMIATIGIAIAFVLQSNHLVRQNRKLNWLTSIAIYTFLKDNGPDGSYTIDKTFMESVGDDIYNYEFAPEFIEDYGIRVRLFH